MVLLFALMLFQTGVCSNDVKLITLENFKEFIIWFWSKPFFLLLFRLHLIYST